ncbi:uncharacterized protein LY89DRAFT_668092 [Mollisia scopiformis]|uniref:Uncharacterized protein n=1 Tax=Mollisia scopiformis TaxID=149040 RepID=A0A194XCJ4_MOLSC|nr:uncharacterized protein LY89DRAFT_668092 [Mollisia scopiformis]KUJ17876.1 hypothetical protein LY89DRAFT_668092 [Mollisia scopiformis]
MATPAATTAPALPKAHPGERLATFFDNLFKTITAISTLGASLTFSKIVQTPVAPWVDYGISKDTAQTYLGLSWLVFVINLGIVSFATAALSLWRYAAIEWFGTEDSQKRRTVMWYATFVSMVLFALIIVAFIFLGLVIAAYAGPVGWSAIGFTTLAGILGFGVIVWQSPIGSKSIGGPPNEDLFRKDSELYGYSPNRKANAYARKLTGDDTYANVYGDGDGYNEKDAMAVKEQYIDDGFGRRNTLDRSPRFADTPEYTNDLRRMRQIRASDEYRYDGRQ